MSALRVLVIEDDAMIGMLLAEMLESMGYDVCGVAATEEDAVDSAKRYKPGLLIVDAQLRQGTGMAAVERIQRTGPVPCVFISGAPLLPKGLDGFVLRKPFLEDELIDAIQHVIGTSNKPASHVPASPHIVTDR